VESQATYRIIAQNVSKSYKKLRVLQNLSFEAYPGEALALWGANGAGKTTLLKAILGLIEFDGRIQVNGCDVRRQGKIARGFIGYVPQEFVFYDMQVVETMQFYARLKHVAAERIPPLLEKVELSEHATKAVSALSGGLRQRLALAVALLADPPLLVLDEPMANLDTRARREYLGFLLSLRNDGKTILFASHRLEEVNYLANRLLVLEPGLPAETIDIETLRKRYLPELNLVLWIAEERRPAAVSCLLSEGFDAHTNGRGTVVVRVQQDLKMHPLQALQDCQIPVLNFDIEELQPWN
jgi:ABC-2 type transport system ATP-binding protein